MSGKIISLWITVALTLWQASHCHSEDEFVAVAVAAAADIFILIIS